MRHRVAVTIRIVLGAFALWLGLWPAGDAATDASRTVVVIVREVPAPAAASACSLEHPADPTGDDAPCCHRACSGRAADGHCPVGKTSRCSQCFSLGGMVLFAASRPSLEPDLALLGTLCPCGQVERSRPLQPPVPPPWRVA
ncbi:MAG: hypothetical protein R3D98_13390 [Candidatus Krumholzibacteriia bacterium]